MKDGFVKVAAITPDVQVANCEYNKEKILSGIKGAEKQGIKLLVFPELCITGYTCGDLFLQDVLLQEAENSLLEIAGVTRGMDVLVILGLPIRYKGKLYNVAAAVQNGLVLGIIPKYHIPNYSEYYEARHFVEGFDTTEYILLGERKVPMGGNLMFAAREMKEFVVGVEICEDLWTPVPPSGRHALAGATMIANLSASNEVTGKDLYRRELVKGQSARLMCGYVYASCGEGESTTDLVFSGHNIIAENGNLLVESNRFQNQMVVTELDLNRLMNERRRTSTFLIDSTGYECITFSFPSISQKSELPVIDLTRYYEKNPFVPSKTEDRRKRCSEIFMIQSLGLKKRLTHTGIQKVVLGISGGLDSTLALLVASKTFEMMGLPAENILAVTMPCFGTTDRTYQNAIGLIEGIGASFLEISIHEAVLRHFNDIGQDVKQQDATYENAQARERTQVLMDLAGKFGGLVVGTGDLSELALGFATYNGDHMSMYGVNASVPKTLVRYLVSYYADQTDNQELSDILNDVLDTPVSPELLPPEEGKISQKTEDIVGPYELHDFFLYYVIRYGFLPSKIYRLADHVFAGDYDSETILKWLKAFYKRFFMQQFKRSCLPDGPKVGSVSLSPRGDFRMPSDASVRLWMKDLEQLTME